MAPIRNKINKHDKSKEKFLENLAASIKMCFRNELFEV